MGKFRKGLSDKVRSKLKGKSKPQPVNPFEIKVNKIKHAVVNKKTEKWEKGIPGVSRSKAIKKRKDTILNEFHHMKKSNSLHDKRIGEKDSNLTPEEKMVQRFAMERKMKSDKQSAFSLNEEEVVLTHYGQSLAENLKDKPGSDSEEDDAFTHRENTGKFQFGGFSGDIEDSTWKDKMNEVVADSKKQKLERQMEKEKSFEATKELDGLWRSVIQKMEPHKKSRQTKPMSAFAMLSRSLAMEQCSGGAADKLKTESQKAREEAEKLQKLEMLRLKRMNGEQEYVRADHVSADSLDNGYAVDKKGKLKVSFSPSDEESDDEENSSNDHESDDEDNENEDEGSGEDSEENSETDDEEDQFSDLDEEDDDEKEISEVQKDDNLEVVSKSKPASILKKSTNVSIKAPQEGSSSLPYTFEAPRTYEELLVLLEGQTSSNQTTVISRLRKCYHPSLAEENKDKLKKIHLFLLQYYGEIVQETGVDKKLMDSLATHLWEMTQMFPNATAKFMQGIVLDKQKEYTALAEKRGGRGLFPSIDTLVYLWLIEMLFPTSDFRHEVTTPAIHYIAEMLAESSVKSPKDIICGLYLCGLCLQFVHSSKRYVPEVITFLHGIVYLASSPSKTETTTPFPPFRKPNKETCQLNVKEKCDTVTPQLSLSQVLHSDLSNLDSKQLRCDLINTCIELLHESITVWSDLPCMSLVMKPLDVQVKFLPSQYYPTALKERVEELSSRIENLRKTKFTAMQHESKRPEPLALFEPKIQENWSGRKKKGGSDRDNSNRQRLLHKYKREMKSAIREVKRDNAVLAQHKLEVTMQKDAERKRKVKEIMGSLSNQEGDFKAIKRSKS